MINNIYVKFKNFIKDNWLFLISLIAIILFTNLRLPYLVETPGGAISLTDRVKIENGYKSEGSFSMAYVTVLQGTPSTILMSKLISSWDTVSIKDYTYEDESYDDSVKRDKLYLQESIDAATIVGYKMAGKEVSLKNTSNQVIYISSDSDTSLEIGDTILKVNGVNCDSIEEIKDVIKDKIVGDKVDFDIIRNNKEMKAYGKLYETDDGPKIGIMTITKYEYETDPKSEITFKQSEGGPSGGLMTTLEVYNKLTEDDLTKGRKIIGTGTISIDGSVGEIGGVKYKLAGAVREKASIFLCPMENLEEALSEQKKHNYDITIIGVRNIEEAIKELKD